jgi:acyl carrier protein
MSRDNLPASFDDFLRRVARELALETEELTASSLADVPGFDSLRMFELDLVLDEMGAVLRDEQLEQLVTIYDAYDAYCDCVSTEGAMADG